MNNIAAYFTAFVSFLIIDGIWLGVITKNFYKNQIGDLMASKVNWLAGGIFYPFYVFGILYFVIIPGAKSGSVKELITRAVLFGLVTYATYDLTNQATLKGWPWPVTIVDILWGAFICTAVSLITYYILAK